MHSAFVPRNPHRGIPISPVIAVRLLAAACVLVLGGCATATFTPLEGKPKPGALGKNAKVNTDWDLPIYSGPPSRPYVVIGMIEADAGEGGIDGLTRAAIREAEANGADGLIVVSADRQVTGVMTTGFGGWPAYGWGGPWPYYPAYGPFWGPYFGGPFVGVSRPVFDTVALFAAFRWL